MSEPNPHPAVVPHDVESAGSVGRFLSEQAPRVRELHDKAMAGDTTFDSNMLRQSGALALYTLGSIGRFYDATAGLIIARYVRFVDGGGWFVGATPCGPIAGSPWSVTNQRSKAIAALGVTAAAVSHQAGSHGWLITEGFVPEVALTGGPAVGDSVDWVSDGSLGPGPAAIGFVLAPGKVFLRMQGVSLTAVATQVAESHAAIEARIAALEESMTHVTAYVPAVPPGPDVVTLPQAILQVQKVMILEAEKRNADVARIHERIDVVQETHATVGHVAKVQEKLEGGILVVRRETIEKAESAERVAVTATQVAADIPDMISKQYAGIAAQMKDLTPNE